jgi:hypothetical protein
VQQLAWRLALVAPHRDGALQIRQTCHARCLTSASGRELRSSRPRAPWLAQRRCHLHAVRGLKPAAAAAGLSPMR